MIRYVYLLWNNTPQMKGEAPELEAIFASQEAAQRRIEALAKDGDYGPDDFSIERREINK